MNLSTKTPKKKDPGVFKLFYMDFSTGLLHNVILKKDEADVFHSLVLNMLKEFNKEKDDKESKKWMKN